MDEDEGVSFLERLLAGRCKPSHHMVPLILVACSLWRLWDSCRVQKELVPEESKGGLERIGGKGKQRHRAKDGVCGKEAGQRGGSPAALPLTWAGTH